jgi:hypothetical protein
MSGFARRCDMTRRINPTRALAAFLLVAGLAAAPVAGAQDTQDRSGSSGADVRKEVSEAMAAIRDYSAARRDEAVVEINEALDRLDVAIDRQEERLRENWAEMSEAARKETAETAAELRRKRNRLSERKGALLAGAESAWEDLKAGFFNAYDELESAWEEGDREPDTAERGNPPG